MTKMSPQSDRLPCVLKTSATLAALLRSDPVAAGLVREHMPADEIIRLFNISHSEMCQIMQITVPDGDGATED